MTDEVLDYDTVMKRMDSFMNWLATQYVTALNCIHYMHDKYSYEAALMALHARDVYRTMACGIAGCLLRLTHCLPSIRQSPSGTRRKRHRRGLRNRRRIPAIR